MQEELEQSVETKKPNKSKYIWLLILVIGLCGSAVWGYTKIDNVTTIDYVDEAFNILIVGVDSTYEGYSSPTSDTSTSRSDTLMLVMIPKNNDKASVVSIPRDTLVKINSSGRQRINSAYPKGGIDLVKSTVEELMGVVIDRYVIVDFEGFKYLVDALGGVEIDVEKRMKYTDNAGDTKIDLQPGLQTLSGEQALGYVRFRHDALGDISRASRQQNFIKALAKQLVSWQSIKEYKKIKEVADKYTKTDLALKDFMALGRRFLSFDVGTIETYTLPGHFMDAYWEPEPESIGQLMASIIGDSSDKGVLEVEPVNGD